MMRNSIDIESQSGRAMAEGAGHIGCADNVEVVDETAFLSLLQSKRRARAIERGDAHGVILAGGRSSRMGADKALLPLGGRPLIELTIDILLNAGLPISISGSRIDLGILAPILADMGPAQGPLTGICSSLRALPAQWVVLLTVDMPLVPSVLVQLMLEAAIYGNAAVVLPSFADRLHPFPCVLHHDLLPGLAAEHAAGRNGCLRAFSAAAIKTAKRVKAVPLESLVASGFLRHQQGFPVDAWLLNVNSPEDLLRAERWIATGFSSRVLSEGNLIEAGGAQCLP